MIIRAFSAKIILCIICACHVLGAIDAMYVKPRQIKFQSLSLETLAYDEEYKSVTWRKSSNAQRLSDYTVLDLSPTGNFWIQNHAVALEWDHRYPEILTVVNTFDEWRLMNYQYKPKKMYSDSGYLAKNISCFSNSIEWVCKFGEYNVSLANIDTSDMNVVFNRYVNFSDSMQRITELLKWNIVTFVVFHDKTTIYFERFFNTQENYNYYNEGLQTTIFVLFIVAFIVFILTIFEGLKTFGRRDIYTLSSYTHIDDYRIFLYVEDIFESFNTYLEKRHQVYVVINRFTLVYDVLPCVVNFVAIILLTVYTIHVPLDIFYLNIITYCIDVVCIIFASVYSVKTGEIRNAKKTFQQYDIFSLRNYFRSFIVANSIFTICLLVKNGNIQTFATFICAYIHLFIFALYILWGRTKTIYATPLHPWFYGIFAVVCITMYISITYTYRWFELWYGKDLMNYMCGLFYIIIVFIAILQAKRSTEKTLYTLTQNNKNTL